MSKPQDTPADPTKVVQKGDNLQTKVEHLTAVPMTIEWSQKWTKRSETYYYVVFENVTQGMFPVLRRNDRGRLWISEKALEEFKHHPFTKDGDYLFKVDEEFQYGQASKDGKGRFLVYHNKNNTPYQHRFVQGIWLKLGQKVAEIAGDAAPGFYKKAISVGEKQLLSAFGDSLHSF